MDQTVIDKKKIQVGANYPHTKGQETVIHWEPPAIVSAYRAALVEEHRSALEMINPRLLKRLGLFAMLIFVANVFDGWPSFLDPFRIDSSAVYWLKSLTSLFAVGSIGYILLMIDRAHHIDRRDFRRSGDTLYVRQLDSSIEVWRISGKCPIPDCSGTLRLSDSLESREGIELVGICRKCGEHHRFEFNDDVYQESYFE